ncbi:MAG: glycoside hydrolase family 28 protein [Faecousia sp.]
MNKTNLRNAILSCIEAPRIGPNQAQAVPDPVRLQTKELQAAIDALSAGGGGRLTLPAGVYRTGALRLKSGVELHLASADTCVQFTAESPEENYPLVFSYWEASPCYNYSALLYACDAEDIAVTGPGTLDGGADGEHWWNWHHQVEDSWSEDKPDLQLEDRKALRRMNQEGIPVEQRIFGPGHWLRPNFFQTIRCRRVLLQGVTLRSSPMWQLNPVQCQSVTVDGVTLSSHGANNDGCDPESCSGVWIKNCRFDTGDDCISLKSGRDRDGREANIPCENILIEHNEFADGHGGVALGSEMSGGIRRVLACDNRFSSPNLTYALRLKTNAKRGGRVEQIMLCDSVMEHVHGAAVHGTMLYEDGRNGDDLPVFRDITIENITAHGGDYGIFLEAFPEVPVTGLELRNIVIDGAGQALRSMNWQNAVVENVVINGKRFPRPGYVRILGVPAPGGMISAGAESCGSEEPLYFVWECSEGDGGWRICGKGGSLTVPENAVWVRVTAWDADGNWEQSRAYKVLSGASRGPAARLCCRGLLEEEHLTAPDAPVTRSSLAAMLLPLADPDRDGPCPLDCGDHAARQAAANGFLPLEQGRFFPRRTVTRQEMATVAMQACGVNYRNASSTMPVCADADRVANNYGTNVARALYFGFMTLEPDGRFEPDRPVTCREAVEILDRVADFAGL